MRYVKVDGLVLDKKKSVKINMDKTMPLTSVDPDDIDNLLK